MAGLPDDGTDDRALTARSRSDDLDIVAQPACPDCGTVLRDAPDGYICGSCGFASRHDDPSLPTPPEFDGPSIHAG